MKILKRKTKDALMIPPNTVYTASFAGKQRYTIKIWNESTTPLYIKLDERPINGWMK